MHDFNTMPVVRSGASRLGSNGCGSGFGIRTTSICRCVVVALRGTVRLLPTENRAKHVSHCYTRNLLTGICLAGDNLSNAHGTSSLTGTTRCSGSMVGGSNHGLLTGCSSIFHLTGGGGRRYLFS